MTTRYNASEINNSYDARDVVRRILGEPARTHAKYNVYYADHRSDGRKPSLTVYADGIKDFGSGGQYWTLVNFVKDRLKLDTQAACEFITGGTAFLPPPRPQSKTLDADPPVQEWQTAIIPHIDKWERILWSTPQVLDYLRKERGLTDETIKHYRLGYNPDWKPIRFQGEELRAAPGITIPWFADGQLYAIRIRTRQGNLVPYTGHDDSDYLDKYQCVTGSKPSAGLFNADNLQSERDVLIVEGEFDCMLAAQYDAIAVTRGSAGDHRYLTKRWLKVLSGAKTVYGLLDNDDAGKKAAEALFGQLTNFIPLPLPDGKDLTEYLLHSGGSMDSIWQETEPARHEAAKRRGQASQTGLSLQQSDNGLWFLGTLPDSLRSATLTYHVDTAAAFIELIHECARQGLIDPRRFTIPEILAHQQSLGFYLAAGTIRDLFQKLEAVFFRKVNTQDDNTVLKIRNNSAGRNPSTFALLPIADVKATILKRAKLRIRERLFSANDPEELVTVFEDLMLERVINDPDKVRTMIAFLNTLTEAFRLKRDPQYKKRDKLMSYINYALKISLENNHSTELPPQPIRNAKDYRAALVYGQVMAGNNHRSGRELAQDLGIRREYVPRLLRYAGISNEEQFESVKINKSNIGDINVMGYEMRGCPRTLFIGGKPRPYSEDDAEQAINEALERGIEVIIRYQLVSKQSLASNTILPTPRAVKGHQHQPQKPQSKRIPRYFGADYNPAWVKYQLTLALKIAALGYVVQQSTLIDKRTGEVLRMETHEEDLLTVLQGKPLEPDEVDAV